MLTKSCDSFRIDHLFRIQLHFRDHMFVISEYSLHLGSRIVFVITGNSLYRGSLQRGSVPHNLRELSPGPSMSFVIPGGFVITGFHCTLISESKWP